MVTSIDRPIRGNPLMPLDHAMFLPYGFPGLIPNEIGFPSFLSWITHSEHPLGIDGDRRCRVTRLRDRGRLSPDSCRETHKRILTRGDRNDRDLKNLGPRDDETGVGNTRPRGRTLVRLGPILV